MSDDDIGRSRRRPALKPATSRARTALTVRSDNPTYLAQLELILSDNAQRERPVHLTATQNSCDPLWPLDA